MARPPQDSKIRINEILNAADQRFFTQSYHATIIRDIAKIIGRHPVFSCANGGSAYRKSTGRSGTDHSYPPIWVI